MNAKFDGWPHIMFSQQFNRPWLEKYFFPLVDQMERVFETGVCNVLNGKRMVILFYEPSTRTRASFKFAMNHLAGDVVFETENAREFSSGAKGESLKHTIKVLNRYRPDVIVLRYDREIGAEIAAEISDIPIMNAGDRKPGQHPTQALLDTRTIKKCRGEIDGLNIAMVGDLKNGRTVRSLSYLLGKFEGIFINFISPKNSAIGDDVKEYLLRHKVKFKESTDLREVAPSTDCIYQTRTQNECGPSFDRKDDNGGYYVVDKTIMDMLRQDAIVMHPLPINDEITSEVDDDARSVYLTHQVDSGLFTRMALLKMILAPKS
ncbi:MAG: aspartate carbamoyltransferase [Candidatus Staskawiczbacteria bacterium]|nr:aspartate carbamoyltransferase [Candidatus Staskawiczbacteria bacterium]